VSRRPAALYSGEEASLARRSPQSIQKRERENAKREKRERKQEKKAAAAAVRRDATPEAGVPEQPDARKASERLPAAPEIVSYLSR